MLETRTLSGSCWRPLVGHVWVLQESLWVSAASFLYWVGYCISLPLNGLKARQMLDMYVISSGVCSPDPYPTMNPLEKGMGKRDQANPNPQSHIRNMVTEAFLTSRCLLELTAVPKCLALEKVLPEDADMITCFSFTQRICSVPRTCTESWHSFFLGIRVFASVMLTC